MTMMNTKSSLLLLLRSIPTSRNNNYYSRVLAVTIVTKNTTTTTTTTHQRYNNVTTRRRTLSLLVLEKCISTTTTITNHNNNNNNKRFFSCSITNNNNNNIRFFSTTTNNTNNNNNNNNIISFKLADIGEGIKEVELIQWYVNVGDVVHEFDNICQVQSDKATVDITSRYNGTITSLSGNVGDMIQVGQPLLFLQTDDVIASTTSAKVQESSNTSTLKVTDDIEQGEELKTESVVAPVETAIASADTDSTTSTTITTTTTNDDDEINEKDYITIPKEEENNHNNTMHHNHTIQTSPAVRKLAKEHNIDLTIINGTGPNGRILKSDVLAYITSKQLTSPSLETTTKTPPPPTTTRLVNEEEDDDDDQIVQLRGYNRLMVQSMTLALQTPHMCFGDEIIMNQLLDCKKQLKKYGNKVSTLAILIKAVSVTLNEHPKLNSIVYNIEQYEMKIKNNHNIGIAMDTSRGLIVPVIKQCQNKSIIEIQYELNRFKEMDGHFTKEDLLDATFTISNIGSIGSGTYMHPVIPPPTITIGTFGRIKRVPRYDKDNTIYPANILTVTWAADHRFIDGASIGRFHNTFQSIVENPYTMLTKLK